MGRLRRWCGQQEGQTAAEYLGVLAVVSVIIAALFVANPGVGELVATGVRDAICDALDCSSRGRIADDPDAPGGDVVPAEGPAGEPAGEPAAPAAEPAAQGEDQPLWRRALNPVTAAAGQAGQFLGGAGRQAWDEVQGLGDTALWAWRTATSAQQRRENGRTWDAIRNDPGGAAASILSGIWDPIQQELDAGRPAAAAGRGATTVLSTIFGARGANRLRQLRPDLDDAARRADGDLAPGDDAVAAARRALDDRIDQAASSANAGTRETGRVAQWIRPRVRGFEEKIGPNGSVGEIDIRTDEALIEVTTARRGKLSQIQQYLNDPQLNPEGRPVILYGEQYTNRAARQAIEDAGAYVVTSRQELEQLLERLAGGAP